MQKKHTTELLKKIYQSSRMGMEISEIFSLKTNSSEFEHVLKKICEKYYNIASEADRQLLLLHELSPENNLHDRIGIWTLTHITPSKSPSAMAEICINGCTEGIIDITRFKKIASSAEPHALELAEKLKTTEHNIISELEIFL